MKRVARALLAPVIASIVIVWLLASCSGHPLNVTEQSFVDCASVDIGKTIPEIGMTLLADVISIVEAGKDGWRTQIAQLIVTYGNDALACAFKAAADTFAANPPHIEARPSPALTRAQQVIAEQGWHYR